MKRSEMILEIGRQFPTLHMECDIDELLQFFEGKGMQPPACTIEKPLTQNMPIYDRHGKVTYKATVNEWEPEITQETVDQALEHIGKKGVRGEMEITE